MTPEELALVRPLIQLAIEEDLGTGDVTSASVVPPDRAALAEYVLKEEAVVCGLHVAREVARLTDQSLGFEAVASDGDRPGAGSVIARVFGSARSILAVERTSLNFLQRMTGIATATRAYTMRVEGTGARILDTRKTAPGHRILDKYAVRVGGGKNHRSGLFDEILIKDNHLVFHSGPGAAIREARVHSESGIRIEVEVSNLGELEDAIAAGADRVLIDNFDPELARRAVGLAAGRVPLEASGGITLDNVGMFAHAGVDFISVGALTHSVRAADIHLILSPK